MPTRAVSRPRRRVSELTASNRNVLHDRRRFIALDPPPPLSPAVGNLATPRSETLERHSPRILLQPCTPPYAAGQTEFGAGRRHINRQASLPSLHRFPQRIGNPLAAATGANTAASLLTTAEIWSSCGQHQRVDVPRFTPADDAVDCMEQVRQQVSRTGGGRGLALGKALGGQWICLISYMTLVRQTHNRFPIYGNATNHICHIIVPVHPGGVNTYCPDGHYWSHVNTGAPWI